jgi:hypothetical protein
MRRTVGAILLCGAVVLLVGAGGAIAAPQVMTDDELDAVSASGGINFELGTDGSLSFNFDMGTAAGNGSVITTPATSVPSTFAFQGSADFTNARIAVENMIFNLNICVQCQGTIHQTGIGIPISIKTTP